MENAVMRTAADAPYEYAVASRALPGERHSGDAALVQATADGVLVAVVDGLGHGDDAAAAATAAIGALRGHAAEPVTALLQRCHQALQATRGAAIALAALDTARQTLTWSGVGNVEAVLIAAGHGPPRARLYLTNRGGVVGYHLPPVQAGVAPLHPGDLLILATDGIDERFVGDEVSPGPPGVLAHAILDRHGKVRDDALVLVLRWLGPVAGKISGRTP